MRVIEPLVSAGHPDCVVFWIVAPLNRRLAIQNFPKEVIAGGSKLRVRIQKARTGLPCAPIVWRGCSTAGGCQRRQFLGAHLGAHFGPHLAGAHFSLPADLGAHLPAHLPSLVAEHFALHVAMVDLAWHLTVPSCSSAAAAGKARVAAVSAAKEASFNEFFKKFS